MWKHFQQNAWFLLVSQGNAVLKRKLVRLQSVPGFDLAQSCFEISCCSYLGCGHRWQSHKFQQYVSIASKQPPQPLYFLCTQARSSQTDGNVFPENKCAVREKWPVLCVIFPFLMVEWMDSGQDFP